MNIGKNTDKAVYWIALGVVALALNNEYSQGSFARLHQVAARADSALCTVSMRAERTLAWATAFAGRDRLPVDNLLASTDAAESVRAQSEMLREDAREEAELLRDQIREQIQDQIQDKIRAQSDVIRQQAEVGREEVEQIRTQTLAQFNSGCKTDRHVTVTRSKMVRRMSL